MPLSKIVSGGQTGVDRGALDAALATEFPCGGWCPWDRAAEDGVIPEKYLLQPVPCGGYRQRTLKNLMDSDGTAILYAGALSGGTKLTRDLCIREKKPFIVLDAAQISAERAAAAVARFIADHGIQVLNVAGPRLSGWPQGHAFAVGVVAEVIKRLRLS
jgi:hypothetical protein